MSQRSTKNNGDSLELVEALQHRISQYEGLIQEMVDNSKKIGIVKAGPFNEEGKVFYRVSSGSDDLMLVHSSDEEIEKDSEVVFTDNYIARVLPKPLAIKKETPDFKRIDWGDVGGLKSQVDEISSTSRVQSKMQNSTVSLVLSLQRVLCFTGLLDVVKL